MAGTNCWQSAIVCETGSKKNGGFRGNINVSFGKMYDWLSATTALFFFFLLMQREDTEAKLFFFFMVQFSHRKDKISFLSVFLKGNYFALDTWEEYLCFWWRLFFFLSRFYLKRERLQQLDCTAHLAELPLLLQISIHIASSIEEKWETNVHTFCLTAHICLHDSSNSNCTLNKPCSPTKASRVLPWMYFLYYDSDHHLLSELTRRKHFQKVHVFKSC